MPISLALYFMPSPLNLANRDSCVFSGPGEREKSWWVCLFFEVIFTFGQVGCGLFFFFFFLSIAFWFFLMI